jgi:hypothetical protein
MPTRANAEITEFIERAGVVFEAEGMPRMAGRVLGYLMVCTPPEQSIDSLMKALSASNGSISTTTRFLEGQGYIDRVSVRGHRKDYFALRTGVAITVLIHGQKSIANLGGLFAQAVALSGKSTRPAIEEAREFFEFLAEEYPAMLERWKKRRERANKTPPR